MRRTHDAQYEVQCANTSDIYIYIYISRDTAYDISACFASTQDSRDFWKDLDWPPLPTTCGTPAKDSALVASATALTITTEQVQKAFAAHCLSQFCCSITNPPGSSESYKHVSSPTIFQGKQSIRKSSLSRFQQPETKIEGLI